mmetsp:Transcript_18008/g.50339  ORF Transcript_18008/g.50339 Transcript_18008/m.50339 type:complete len:441 (-) Transcript_18008:1858-3180(-)|eukprot:CAMPEP_0202383772 /NCGR_PEP_ID=MMETSP1127-20130417/51208_1 /ASSEMBLY_ACC=CAM_ASM_000462 /TAXON_ID=3047 /ORGANISM="Dunaliella tertiolecta, Strain CCMP1320" /LENGTH=440 /DNA_ID=CAMNT_0048983353 /DNA_START=56 /DNA_END=1378 /DNA_ORIENTATION=+
MGFGRRTTVVVGGSFAGRRVASLLASDPCLHEVVLVEEKGYTEFTPSILRTLVEPGHPVWEPIQATGIPVKVVTGRAAGASLCKDGQHQGQLALADGRTLPYHFLVIATGSSYLWPIKAGSGDEVKLSTRKEAVSKAAEELRSAGSIAVVGGGPVGVELAAELAGKFGRSKNIVLLTNGSRLLQRMPQKAGYTASRWLRLAGVEVLHGAKVVQWPEGSRQRLCSGTLITQSGREISADLTIDCTGVKLNTELYTSLVEDREGGPEAAAEASRQGIPVKPTLEVVGCPGVFACGDAAGVAAERTAYTADLMAVVVAKNIALLVSRKDSKDAQKKLKEFPGGALSNAWLGQGLQEAPSIAAISLYKYDGIMQFNNLIITGPLAAGTKVMVEFFQLGIARGNTILSKLWLTLEAMNTVMAALPLVLWHKWTELKAFVQAYEAF